MRTSIKGQRQDNMPEIFCKGTSMHPLFKAGDILEFRPCDVLSIRKGDVIVLTPPGEGNPIVHRVIERMADRVRTRGDGNPLPDPWVLSSGHILGRVVSCKRAGRSVPVIGGSGGHVLACAIQLLRKADHHSSAVLHPVYRYFSRKGVARRLVPPSLAPRIITLQRQEGREMLLLMGRAVIGRRPAGQRGWTIRRPFRIFVDEEGLP
jgi:signal peptidase I